MVDSAIRQTRCSACETEHVFKGGHQPKPRKKEEAAGVLVHAPNGSAGSNGHTAPADVPTALAATRADEPTRTEVAPQPREPEADAKSNEFWSGHRRLIRATLPKVEGTEPPPRAIPEFTMHQRNVRGGHAFRQGQPWHDRGADGQRRGRPGFGGGGNGNGNGNHNGNGNIPDNIGNGAGPGNHRPGGRRRRRRGRKPGGPV